MYSLLSGLYDYLTQKPSYKILVCGLDNSGKTTLLEQVKKMHGQKYMDFKKITSTIGLNICKLEKSNGEFTLWDVGGQVVLRKLWEKYFNEAHGLIFVIDGADDMRLPEVKETLHHVFTTQPSHDLESVNTTTAFDQLPVLFLLNKQDSKGFKGVDFVTERTNLGHLLTSAQRRNSESMVMAVSAIDTQGIEGALAWIMAAVSESSK
ncbi:hypothetical protein FGO68_gene16299 [Halteria grandinella]|uniref:Uncharacterized protein n=1 Tax=Halteria grandinella TaxID=5974 RepID=A0A8J8NIL4_HALGN|nr:hypothetical protein FGO68_gene16299 [Halteria grandinella]